MCDSSSEKSPLTKPSAVGVIEVASSRAATLFRLWVVLRTPVAPGRRAECLQSRSLS